MGRRISFQANAPIGRVVVGKDTFLVIPTEVMARSLKVVQDAVNAVESGVLASDVVFIPSGGLSETRVQGALQELDLEKASVVALTAHITDTTDAHAASAITNTPAGAIAATTVQGAIDELDAEKQPKDATLTALAGLGTGADRLAYSTGTDTFAETDLTAFGRALLDDANAPAARTTLGLVIGTNVQAWDADLDTWATKTAPSGTVVGTSDTQTLSAKTLATPVITGTEYTEQGAVTSKAAAATLTIAELLTRIIQYTGGAAAALTLPTGANIEAGVLSGLANDRAFDFAVINTGSDTATVTTAAGLTLVGAMAVTAGTSGQFRVRKTATDTYTVYRLA